MSGSVQKKVNNMNVNKFNQRSSSTDMTASPKYYGQSERFREGSQMFHSGYMDSDTGVSLDRNGNRRAPRKRIQDGTSTKEIQKAMMTYLNKTGAGDYNLPKLTGEKIIEANRRN